MCGMTREEAKRWGYTSVNQVLTVHTRYGFVCRCAGCPWRSIHDDAVAAAASGQRHTQTHREEKGATE